MLIRIRLVAGILFAFPALSTQEPPPQPRSILSGDALGPSNDRVLTVSFTTTNNTAQNQATENAGTDNMGEETSEEVKTENPIEEPSEEVKAEIPMKPAETPIKTAETPMKTAETPMKTAETPIKTAETPMKTAETPIKTAETPMKTAETPIKTAEPHMKTAETPIKTAETPMKTAENPMKPAETPIKTAENPMKAAENPMKTEVKERMNQSEQHTLTTVLLKDIRDALNKKSDDLEEEFRINVKNRLDSLTLKVQDSVSDMSTDLERMRDNMDQKVNLMLESFSTLRLLVVGQGQSLNDLRERLQDVEDEVKQLQKTTQTSQKPPTNYDAQDLENPVGGQTNPGTENRDTDLQETVHNTTKKLEDLKIQVQNISEEVCSVKDELQDLQGNMTNIYTVSSTPKPLTSTTTASSISCQCSTEDLRSAVDKLETSQKKQKSDFVQLKRRISVVESFRGGIGGYSDRVGIVETPLQPLKDVKTAVTAVQDDSNDAKEGIEEAVTSNATLLAKKPGKVGSKGMCVWPYKRGGGGCYYVNSEDRLGWGAARDHCRGLQGDLATPAHIPSFRSFIHGKRLSRAYTYWMGASNTNEEGRWEWTDGRAVTGEVWESQLTTSRAPRCMALKTAYRFGALAEGCHESKFFICQQERLL